MTLVFVELSSMAFSIVFDEMSIPFIRKLSKLEEIKSISQSVVRIYVDVFMGILSI
ncbi:MAG: hypothetical protein P8Y70_17645 [Candidatus Lokiarchaeota archaeon]